MLLKTPEASFHSTLKNSSLSCLLGWSMELNRAGIADKCIGIPWTNILLCHQPLRNTYLFPWWEWSQLFDLCGLMVVAFLAKQNLAAHPLLWFGRITESHSTWHNMVKVFHVLSRDGLVVVSILAKSKGGGRRESKHEITKSKLGILWLITRILKLCQELYTPCIHLCNKRSKLKRQNASHLLPPPVFCTLIASSWWGWILA